MAMDMNMATAMARRADNRPPLASATSVRALLLVGAGVAMGWCAGDPGKASAQSRTIRGTATIYGARLNARGDVQDLNPARINNRVNNRVNNRIRLRIERFVPDESLNPTSAYRVPVDDGIRRPLVIARPDSIDEDQP